MRRTPFILKNAQNDLQRYTFIYMRAKDLTFFLFSINEISHSTFSGRRQKITL